MNHGNKKLNNNNKICRKNTHILNWSYSWKNNESLPNWLVHFLVIKTTHFSYKRLWSSFKYWISFLPHAGVRPDVSIWPMMQNLTLRRTKSNLTLHTSLAYIWKVERSKNDNIIIQIEQIENLSAIVTYLEEKYTEIKRYTI